MEIRTLRLHNIGRFESLEIPFAPTPDNLSNITVFIGNNGTGKSIVLKSLATALSWFIARLRSEKGSGSPIAEDDILNGQPAAAIELALCDQNAGGTDAQNKYQWTLVKAHKGRKAAQSSQLSQVSKLADYYRQALTADENTHLPLIAFYPVERVVLDIPLKIRGKHSFLQLDGYDNSLSQGVDFRRFFEWFRDREDAENETGLSQELLSQISTLISKDTEVWQKLQTLNASSRDRQLTAVRTAIGNFMNGFSNLRVHRKPRLQMSIDKNGVTLNVQQLSQGEKSLMALVGDIARRLAMMNPLLENPLEGKGMILIDEVDLHLHPAWQRNVITRLTSTFPNCQFILTTHSALVISECKDALVYSLDDELVTPVPSQYGQDANTVLLDVMNTHIRNIDIAVKLGDLFDLIQDRQLVQAKVLLNELEQELPASHIELIKARLLLRKQELRGEKN